MKGFNSGFAPRITKYLDYRVACGYSRETDEKMLAKFDKFCIANFPNAHELTREIVWGWIDSENTSIPNKSTAIRNFAKHMRAYGCDAYILTPNGQSKEKGRIMPHMFTPDELRALFLAADKIKSRPTRPYLPTMLSVMFRLIYTCGLRPNEGRELLCENVDMKTGVMRIVNTKGKKERLVVMSEDMRKLCADYDEKRKEFAGANPYFFPSDNGGVYTDKVIQQWFKECWAAANPSRAASTLPTIRVYDLRHVFATSALTKWIEAGANIKAKLSYLQAYMGHDSINETLYYVHLLPETLLSGGNWETLPEQGVQ